MSIDFQLMLRMSRGDPCSLISLIRPICQCPGCELSPSLSGFAHIKSDSNRSSEYLNRSVGLAGAQFRLFESSLQAVHLSTQSGVFACSAYEERLVRSKTALSWPDDSSSTRRENMLTDVISTMFPMLILAYYAFVASTTPLRWIVCWRSG